MSRYFLYYICYVVIMIIIYSICFLSQHVFTSADVGTYFCEKLSKDHGQNHHKFVSKGGEGKDPFLDSVFAWKKFVAKDVEEINSILHVTMTSPVTYFGKLFTVCHSFWIMLGNPYLSCDALCNIF